MSKHTPGPWRIVQDRVPASLEVYAGKTAIAECWRRADVETEIANARLIAAAPCMAEALQALIACDFGARGWDDNAEHAAMKARSAIAKATGSEG